MQTPANSFCAFQRDDGDDDDDGDGGSAGTAAGDHAPLPIPLGQRVFVNQGSMEGVPGNKSYGYFASVSSHLGGSYGVTPISDGRRDEKTVLPHSVTIQNDFLSDVVARVPGQKTSQQKKKELQLAAQNGALEKALAREKEARAAERAKLLKKWNMTVKENKTMAAEREACFRGKPADGKLTISGRSFVNSIITVVREAVAVDMEAAERKVTQLSRQVSHREKQIAGLERRLQKQVEKEKSLRRLKNSSLADNRKLRKKLQTVTAAKTNATDKVDSLNVSLRELKAAKAAAVADAEAAHQARVVKTRTTTRGRPYTDEFEAHAVASLSTGISAPQLRQQMIRDKEYILGSMGLSEDDIAAFEIPEVDWFERMRERLGNESLVFAFAKVAAADEVIQYGCDETAIHRQATLNQWVRIKNPDGSIETVTIEAVGILVGGTAEEVAAHVEAAFDRGQELLEKVREELGPLADELMPLKNGGVNMHKLRSLMHDTCNTANATAREIASLIEKKGKEFFGDDGWAGLPDERKQVLDFLCGNHTRGLPVDAFNRRFEKWLDDEYGELFKTAAAASGSHSRLEKSGKSLLRALSKLIHSGFGAYAKGDGEDFKDLMRKLKSVWSEEAIGRVELSKRQDWCLEAAAVLFPIVNAIQTYTNQTRQLDANTLRDSVSQLLENHCMQAYIHACAALWEFVFAELRALTNSTTVELSPVELNDVYDKLYELGTLLQGANALDIFKDGYRPWPIHTGSSGWHAKRSSKELKSEDAAVLGNKQDELRKLLRSYESREDAAAYTPVLKQVLRLFGEGIHESLNRTMSNYLEKTGGDMAASKLEPWMKELAADLICHNNHAERPFAIAKYLDHIFQSMSLKNLAGLSLAKCNGTFALPPQKPKTKKAAAKKEQAAGAATTAPPALKAAVSRTCSVRRTKDGVSGTVSAALREYRENDEGASDKHRKTHRSALLSESERLAKQRAQKQNKNSEVVLIKSAVDLDDALEAVRLKGKKKELLSAQFDGRVGGRRSDFFVYPEAAIGMEFRSSHFSSHKLRKAPADDEDEVDYLTRLVKAMIAHDVSQQRYLPGVLVAPGAQKDIARELPVIDPGHVCAHSAKLKADEKKRAATLMAVEDDAELLDLEAKYNGQLLYENDEGQGITWKVTEIVNGENSEFEYWEAVVVAVERDGVGGWRVPESSTTAGGRVHGDKADGFYLKDITHDICCSDVDDMIQAHKEREEEENGDQMDTDEATGTRDEEPPAKRPRPSRADTGRSAPGAPAKKYDNFGMNFGCLLIAIKRTARPPTCPRGSVLARVVVLGSIPAAPRGG